VTVAGTIDEGLGLGQEWGRRFAQSRGKRAGEIDILLGIFVAGLPEMRRELSFKLRPLGLESRMGWVYCHQSPIVGWSERGHEGSCELGDLLVVVRNSIGGRVSRRALLVQFKVGGGRGVSGDQAILYTEWPVFHYKKKEHRSKRRSVHPKEAHRGAQVGLIAECPGCGEPHGEISSQIVDGGRVRLAEELAALILGGGGREFASLQEVRRKRNWDRVVWDLIGEVTAVSLSQTGFGARRRDLDGIARLILTEGVPGLMAEASSSPIGEDTLELRYIADGWDVESGPLSELGERPRLDSSGAISTLFIDVTDATTPAIGD
jgi:hypothetical protein